MPGRRSEQRVVLLPATRRDGQAVAELLAQNGLWCRVCASIREVVGELASEAGIVVLTDSAFGDSDFYALLAALKEQPSWSDIPLVLLSSAGTESARTMNVAGFMSNVTLLERPTTSRTLLSAIFTGLRSRQRQYELREQLTALRDVQEAMRVADRRKDEFLAMLAHELRNPLAPLRNASELLPRLVSTTDPRVGSTIGMVQRQVTQLTRLVDDLLDISRITQGRIEMQRSTQDLASLVAHAIESVEPAMREKGHRVLQSICKQPLHVDGDGARLLQSMANVLMNAAKYTDSSGEIHVDLRQDGSSAVFSVRDNGIGLPPELIPSIFDLFVQGERSLDRTAGGLGLGLCIVKRIVDMHGGAVTARSDGPGKGSTFEIRLPLAAAPAPDRRENPRHLEERRRVLVVDDNADAADSLAMMFRLNGHDVETVYNAADTLVRAAAFDPEVILLDIGLPEMDGYTLARRLRASGSGARLIALTGYGRPDDVSRALEAGFDAHVTKPVDFAKLEDMLSSPAVAA